MGEEDSRGANVKAFGGLESRKTSAPPAMSRAEERALLAAAQSGDRRAVGRILRAVADPALRFGRSFCRHDQDAEDVMQDVLTSLARSLGSFRGDAALSTWAYRVARRACLRRRTRASLPLEPLDPIEAARHPDGEPGPERGYERRQLARRIEAAIAALPRPQREVLVLRDVEGLSAAEVGRVLGLTDRAVKSRLHRARLALRASLAPSLERSPEGGARSQAVARRRGCPDTARLVSRYLEGELGASACVTLARHVEGCSDCGAVCDGLRAALAACRDYGATPLPDEVSRRIRETIRAHRVMARRSRPLDSRSRRAPHSSVAARRSGS
jgi:RNA polymerase sigma-70 factor, ECF subfamily